MKQCILVLGMLVACKSSSGNAPPADGSPGPGDGAEPVTDAAPGNPGDAGSDAAAAADPFAALQALPATCSPDQWCWRAPRPAGNDYSRIYASAPDNLWLIGQHGTVMQWNGQAWTAHHPPVPAGQPLAQFPMSISGRGAADMWLIFGNTVEHWDGAAWSIRTSLPPNGIIAFDSIWEASNGDVWVTMNNGSMMRSTAGGAFQLVSTGCNNCFLGSIWGVAPDDFFVTTLPAGILHYDGQTFVRSYKGPLIAGSYLGTKNDVWVSGADGAMLHWDGTAWATLSTGLTTNWNVEALGAVASNDVWWWTTRNSAMAAFVHWDGTALTTTPVDTTNVPSLFSGAIVGGRWWLVGGSGAVYTRSARDAIAPIIAPPPTRGTQAVWGSTIDNMYFATGGEIDHRDGTSIATMPIAANQISGVRTGGVDELFATGFDVTPDQTQYIASAYHFDGASWTKAQLEVAPVQQHRYFSQVFAMGPGEAMAVGYGGIAYHFTGGSWNPVATGVTTDLLGVWGPDPDHVWMTGAGGTLLAWKRTNPGAAIPDPTGPATTDDLGPIHGADGITWIGATSASHVWMSAASGWTAVPTGLTPSGVFAVSATNVVVTAAGQSAIARWNGTQFVSEDNASGMPTPIVFQPPGGPMVAGGMSGFVQHP